MEHREIKEAYFLTPAEYVLLLAGTGSRKLYTLQTELAQIDQGAICLAMNHLYQTGLVSSAQETFLIRRQLRELLTGIHQAEYALLFQTKDISRCCFVREKSFVAVEHCTKEEQEYKLYALEQEELLQDVCRRFLKPQRYQPALEEEAMYQELLKERRSISPERLSCYVNLHLAAEQADLNTGRVQKRLLLRQTREGRKLEAIARGRVQRLWTAGTEGEALEALEWLKEVEEH